MLKSVCVSVVALQLCFERLVDSELAGLDAVYAKYELLYYDQHVYKLLLFLCSLP